MPIGDNRVAEAGVLHYYVENEFSWLKRVYSDLNRFVVDYFCNSIDNKEDQIIDLAVWVSEDPKTHYKIY